MPLSHGDRLKSFRKRSDLIWLDKDCICTSGLNALGKMLADCDYSFASQRNIDAPAYNEISLVDLALNEKYSNIE